MKKILLISLIFILHGCSKPKSVLICGDHVCVNKAEAEQYFEDNLSLEVQIVNNNRDSSLDLVELNLKSISNGKKEITVINKKETKKKLKVLSKDEIELKKAQLKKRKENKNLTNKVAKDNEKLAKKNDNLDLKNIKINEISENNTITKNINKNENKIKIVNKSTRLGNNDSLNDAIIRKGKNDIVDICEIIEKCSIDEISKYLIKYGREKDFPNIASREQ
jgi:hypothetical protein